MAALAEFRGWIPSTHMAASRGGSDASSGLLSTASTWQIARGKAPIDIKNENKSCVKSYRESHYCLVT